MGETHVQEEVLWRIPFSGDGFIVNTDTHTQSTNILRFHLHPYKRIGIGLFVQKISKWSGDESVTYVLVRNIK